MSGKAFRQDTRIQKIFRQSINVRKVYFKNDEVFSSAHDVAYHIDVDNIVYKEIEDETDAISQAPAATKTGWTFVGWRIDTHADPNVLPSYIVTDDEVHLYAVFSSVVTVSLVGGDSTIYDRGTRYYNNAVYANANITLSAATLSGWSLVGYRTDTVPDPNNIYRAGWSYSFAQNTTLYTVFSQTVTCRVTSKGVLYTFPRARYVNNGNYNNPVVYFSNPVLDDAIFQGYSNSSSSITVVITTLANGYAVTHDIDFFAVWHNNDHVLLDDPEGVEYVEPRGTSYFEPPRVKDTFSFNGTRFASLEVTLKAFVSPGGAWVQNPAWGSLGFNGAAVTRVIFASTGSEQGDWEDGPCANGQTATVSVGGVPDSSPATLQFIIEGQAGGPDDNWVLYFKIVGIGRTFVY